MPRRHRPVRASSLAVVASVPVPGEELPWQFRDAEEPAAVDAHAPVDLTPRCPMGCACPVCQPRTVEMV